MLVDLVWLIKASIPNFSSLVSPEVAVSLLSRVGVGGWVVITRFQAKSQFKLDCTGTELELSLAISKYYPNDIQVLPKTVSINCQNIKQIIPTYCQNIISPLTHPPGQNLKPEATNPKIISVSKYYSDIIKILYKYLPNNFQIFSKFCPTQCL